jgi:aubergine-like protein
MTLKARELMPHKPPANPGDEQFAQRKAEVLANYFKVTTKNSAIYQYAVAFDPPLDSRTMRYSMIASHSGLLGETFAFDGMQLFLLTKLENKVTYVKSTRSQDNQDFEISIQLTNELEPRQCYQLYNIIFRKILRLMKLKQIGRHYFDPSKPAVIPQHNMELWPGYITAISEYDGGAMLNIDVAHKVLRTDTVLDHINSVKRRFKGPAESQEAVSQYLVGQVVLTRYNNKTYHIDAIAWDLTPKSTFKIATGEEISYVDYYKKNYSKTISDLNQPLLLNKSKKKKFKGGQRGGSKEEEIIYLVPELCCMTGFTDEIRADFNIMKALSEHTIVAPQIRKAGLETFINLCYTNQEIAAELARWKIEFSKDLLSINARVLNPENIFFKNRKVQEDPQSAEWSREMKQINLIQTFNLTNWVLISSVKTGAQAAEFSRVIQQVGKPFGIEVAKPKEVGLQNDSAGGFVQAIKENYVHGQTQLVVCILPDQRKERYDAIKKYCVSEQGIVSQCVLSKTIAKEKVVMSACTKIIMQMNVKLGGQLWAVEIPMKNAMTVGIDVYHDSLNKGTSVAGFIASVNDEMTKYYSRVVFQRSSQELIDGLKQCFSDSLRKYHELRGALPQRIIVFRDGVGDGQLNSVVNHEVEQMREVFNAFGGQYQPKLAVVVVKKRINTRIMAKAGGQVNNPLPGTLVTNGCTGHDTYDYFLCAQSVRQGTATPTNYHVVHDSSGLQPIHLQALTFKLTHLYYNWPGTVRVPAPCQYAHKIAFLVGQSVHRDPHLGLADKLYFL